MFENKVNIETIRGGYGENFFSWINKSKNKKFLIFLEGEKQLLKLSSEEYGKLHDNKNIIMIKK